MDGESLISWNLANFVTIILMMAILWVLIGSAGHLLFRSKNQSSSNPMGVVG